MSARTLTPRTIASLIAGVCMAIRPRFPGGIGAWARAQKVPITSIQNTTYAGEKYDFDRFPVVASLMFGFFEHPTARELFVEKSVQTAFTTVAFFACAWQLVEGDPGNIIYVMHTRDAARDKLKDVMNPIFNAIPALRGGQMSSIPGADAESTAEAMRFPGGTLYVGGGQSASILTSTPARIVLLDEAERHAFMGKSTTFELARGRLTAADDGKLVAFSKPEQQATFTMDQKTGEWKTRPKLLALMDAEWVSGDQREFHCPCPHCGTWNPIRWEDIKFKHLNEALPGMKQPLWNWDRFESEVFWQCPIETCQGRVHEGPEKRAMILTGAAAPIHQCWPPALAAHRREKAAFPRAHPHKWSATVSALTDVAFSSLTWGKLAIRWINAQGDPTKIINFLNEILGKPERPHVIEDTTIEHLKKLIPPPGSRDPLPWRYRNEDGTLSGIIPLLSTQLSHVGMVIDRQQKFLRYGVRAFGNDGRSYLLDQGTFPDLAHLSDYLRESQFTTLDGTFQPIDKAFMDLAGGEADSVAEAYDFCWAHHPQVEGIRGVGDDATGRLQRNREGGMVWKNKRPNCPERAVEYWEIDSQYFEKHLYETRLQNFDPKRHRTFAPAPYFPTDIEDDYLKELTAMHVVDVPVRKGSYITRAMYVKKSSAHINDAGDIEKYFCAMDYVYGGRQFTPGLQPDEPPAEAAPETIKDYSIVAPPAPDPESKVRDYLLK